MFIGRNAGVIYGAWAVRQWDGQEELADNAPELVAFLNPPPDPRRVLDAEEAVTVKADAQVQTFLNFTPAELDAWVDANIPAGGQRTAFKVLGRIALAAGRGKALR